MIAETTVEGIGLAQRLVPLLAAVAVTGMTLELIRRRKLREEYAMLWIAASIILLVFAIIPKLLPWISNTIGVYYITLMVMMMFCFLSLLIIHLAVAASRSADETQKIAQRLALLEHKLERLDGGEGVESADTVSGDDETASEGGRPDP